MIPALLKSNLQQGNNKHVLHKDIILISKDVTSIFFLPNQQFF